MIVRQPLEVAQLANKFDIIGAGRGRRHHRPGRRHPPRHHARADRVRRVAAQAAAPGRFRHARCARGRAQEGRPSQGSPRNPVLEALVFVSPPDGGSSSGRTADSDSANLGSNPSPPANSRARSAGPFRLQPAECRRVSFHGMPAVPPAISMINRASKYRRGSMDEAVPRFDLDQRLQRVQRRLLLALRERLDGVIRFRRGFGARAFAARSHGADDFRRSRLRGCRDNFDGWL